MGEISTAFATPVNMGTLDTASNFAGHITITTAGSPVQGPDISSVHGFILSATTTNSGYCWVYPHSGSKTTQGFPIPGGQQTLFNVTDLNEADFDADTNGNIISWLKL